MPLNIILVSDRMSTPKTFNALQLGLGVLGLILFTALFTIAFIVPQNTAPQENAKLNGVKKLLRAPLNFTLYHPQKQIDALAVQLGEMQARLMQLNAQSERLSKIAGVKPDTTPSKPGAGGPQVLAHPMSDVELQTAIQQTLDAIALKEDYLSQIETQLIQHSMEKNMLPDFNPVQGAYNSSSYGWRVDPFTGNHAFHEGLDFTAQTGTPIYAAAGGIVSTAVQMPDYGKIVKINHGSGVETRYAHASKLLVKEGDVVKKGQLIALVGSTGRSTGAHLHFEVRRDGAPLDPRKFIKP